MKHLILLSFVAVASTLITGCATQRQMQVVERVSKDTIYMNKVQYDSIYISQDKYVDRTRDTIYIQEKSAEYRYKLLRDTVYKVRIDTIPVIREVEVVKEVPRPLTWYDHLSRAALWLIIGALLLFKIGR